MISGFPDSLFWNSVDKVDDDKNWIDIENKEKKLKAIKKRRERDLVWTKMGKMNDIPLKFRNFFEGEI